MHSDRVSTTGSEGRKSSKPIMEKRRRARINASLAELKSLLLEVIKKEGARHSKMEKADILEMAVKHLRQVQRQQYTSGGGGGGGADPTLSGKYRLGFNECAQEVSRYLGAADDDDAELRARLLNHLANCITGTEPSPSSPLSSPSSSPAPLGHVSSSSGVVGSGGGGGVGGVVTPLTPIPVRPVSAKVGSVSGLSLQFAQGDCGGISPPPPTAAVLVPTTEINNNNVLLANNNNVALGNNNVVMANNNNNNNVVMASMTAHGAVVDFRNGSHHQMTLSPLTSPATSLPGGGVGGKVGIGEVQVVGTSPKAGGGGGGEMALVLPANVMTGGHLPSYIIPLYASPHPLSAASLSFTPTLTTPHAANLALTPTTPSASQLPPPPPQAPAIGTLPLSLPMMTSPTTPASARVATAGSTAAPSLFTLTTTPGASPAVLPPASVGHVIATGLKTPLTWQAAAATFSASPPPPPPPPPSVSSSSPPSSFLPQSSTSPSSSFLPPSSSSPSSSSFLPSSSIRLGGLCPSSLAPSEIQPDEDRVTSSVSRHFFIPVSAVPESSEACADCSGGLSLLHSQLMRPAHGSVAVLQQSADGCVWRPW
ncbi:hypothetical protein ACOMHN_016482 [Nucella lapillus]